MQESCDALTDVCAYAAAAAVVGYMFWVEFCSFKEWMRKKPAGQRRSGCRRQQGRRTKPANQALQVKSQIMACNSDTSHPKQDGCCLLRMHGVMIVCTLETCVGDSIGWFQSCAQMVSNWKYVYLTQCLLSQAFAAACSLAEP